MPSPPEGPLFLVGAPRSGTSLIYKLLCLHPEVAYVSNWIAHFPRRPWLGALNRFPRAAPAVQRAAWFEDGSNAYVYGRRRPLHRRLVPAPVEGEPLYEACGVPQRFAAGDPAPEPTVAGLRRAFATLRRSAGGRIVVSKRIANNRRIALLEAAFPGARYLSILRDGRAVALSLSKVDWWETTVVPWYGGTPADWRSEGGDPWELCARTWVEELRDVEEGLAGVDPDRVLGVRYEDFVADPPSSLARIAGFAGLDRSGRWQRRLSTLSFPDRNEAWRSLEPEVIDRITAVQKDALEAHGYEV